MKKIVLTYLIVTIISTISYGTTLVEFTNEFMKVNSSILENQSVVEKSKLQYDGLDAMKSWNLTFSTSYDKNRLDSSSQSFYPYKMRSHSLGLQKAMKWGGTFAIQETLISTDLLNIKNKSYQFENLISYTQEFGQNFLGRQFYLDLDIARKSEEVASIQLSVADQMLLLNLYSTYIKARLSKTLLKLHEEALARATKRKKDVERKVRDGLRDKVDLYRAKISLLSSQENVQMTTQDHESNLEELSKLIHRKVTTGDIERLPLDLEMNGHNVTGSLQNNKDYKLLKKQIDLVKDQVRRVDMSFFPTISLSTNYKTNKINQRSSKTYSKGFVGSSTYDMAIALNVSLPLGFETQNVQRQEKSIDLRVKKMKREKLSKDLEITEKSLSERVAIFKRNIQSSQVKLDLAHKALKAQNRNYRLGRIDYDMLLGSEEELIGTEQGLINYISGLYNLLGVQAQLYGTLLTYMRGFEE
jgi:outer membrane protein TolC